LYDVGEQKRVMVISVAEGEDKPLKYPEMYKTADVCLINKADLLPYVDVDIERLKENVHRVNGNLRCIALSCSLNSGMTEWFDWLRTLKTSTKA
jgi:hydrogenase nickel incorporation protein HypB